MQGFGWDVEDIREKKKTTNDQINTQESRNMTENTVDV